MSPFFCRRLPVLSFLLAAGLAAGPRSAPCRADSPPVVTVSRPVEREVTDYADFTGRLDADTVEVRSRVTGWLDRVHFKPGSEVKQGDLLFDLDPRTYQADLDQANAKLAVAEARLKLAQADYQRAQALQRTRATSQEEVDKSAAAQAEAVAALKLARLDVERARLNLEFTRITAPLAGRIGQPLVTPGSRVSGSTLLATIVVPDPIHVQFDMDERTFLHCQHLPRGERPQNGRTPLVVGLADEKGFPHQAVLDYIDNRVNPSTGTIRVRGTLPNPRHLLIPGLFARVRVPLGKPYKALLVPESALLTDRSRRYLLVVNDRNVTERRDVKVGPLQDGMRVIEEGLKPDERVLVRAIGNSRAWTAGIKLEPQHSAPAKRP
jgi:multidrug efflux system membrane fusion protein